MPLHQDREPPGSEGGNKTEREGERGGGEREIQRERERERERLSEIEKKQV